MFDPTENRVPGTRSVAVAVPFKAASVELPKLTFPKANVTVPDGIAPFTPATVAVKVTVSMTEMEDGVAMRVRLVLPRLTEPTAWGQFATRVFASIEPRPVAWSYPGPASYP
jgi:hypothetical protein